MDKLTLKDLEAIAEALGFISSGEMEEHEHTIEEFEAAQDKIQGLINRKLAQARRGES